MLSFLLLAALGAVALPGNTPSQKRRQQSAVETTREARQLALGRIHMIARTSTCRADFVQQQIDLERLKLTANLVRFYSVVGPEGDLKFSEVIGIPASPDQTLRSLALQLPADAFVLGYQDGRRYVRTRHVVLGRGYFQQPDSGDGSRPTTVEEKQGLLLHELLHIALDKDDDALNARELCPLRLLAFCRRPPASSATAE